MSKQYVKVIQKMTIAPVTVMTDKRVMTSSVYAAFIVTSNTLDSAQYLIANSQIAILYAVEFSIYQMKNWTH